MSSPHFNLLFIVESPSPEDLLDNRREGNALASVLKLGGINSHNFQVADVESLKLAFERAAVMSREKEVMATFHFSMHGDKTGIQLTSGEMVSWVDLRMLFLRFGDTYTAGRKVRDVIHTVACFSTCEGLAAGRIFDRNLKMQPCFGVVGAMEKVAWSDALTAFVVYYHLTMVKESPIMAALDAMNAAAGLDNVFSAITPKNFFNIEDDYLKTKEFSPSS